MLRRPIIGDARREVAGRRDRGLTWRPFRSRPGGQGGSARMVVQTIWLIIKSPMKYVTRTV